MKRVDSDRRVGRGPSLGKLLVIFSVALVVVVGIGLGITTFTQKKGSSGEAEMAITTPESASKEAVVSAGPQESVYREIKTSPTTTQSPTVVVEEPVELAGPPETIPAAIPPEEPVTYAEAESVFRAAQYDEAVGKFVAYVAGHPENAWGYYMLGLSNWKAGHSAEAESAFLQALDLDPDHTKSLANLARVRLDACDYAGALEPAEKAVDLQPQSVEAQRVMGRVLHNLGRREEAIEAYGRVLALRDTDLWALNNFGLLLIEEARFSEAIPPLARAVEQDPGVACIQNNLGVALERAGYFREAVAAYGNALAADSTYAKAEISRQRAEGLVLTQSLSSLDLAVAAREFKVPGTASQGGSGSVASANVSPAVATETP